MSPNTRKLYKALTVYFSAKSTDDLYKFEELCENYFVEAENPSNEDFVSFMLGAAQEVLSCVKPT